VALDAARLAGTYEGLAGREPAGGAEEGEGRMMGDGDQHFKDARDRVIVLVIAGRLWAPCADGTMEHVTTWTLSEDLDPDDDPYTSLHFPPLRLAEFRRPA
jgi:hypothetical protein